MENNIRAAVISARAKMTNPPMNGRAQYGKYATLGDILAIVLPALAAEGVMLSQRIFEDRLETVAITPEETLLLDSRTVDLSGTSQQQGSAETYAKRYALCSVFCLVGMEDDDGAAASSPAPPKSNAARNKAVKRLNAAIDAYCETHNTTPEACKASVKKRPEFEDTADFYNMVAEEFESEA